MVIGLYGVLYLEVAEAGARMVAGGGGARGKSAWSDWTAAINLDRAMAQVDYPPVDHK